MHCDHLQSLKACLSLLNTSIFSCNPPCFLYTTIFVNFEINYRSDMPLKHYHSQNIRKLKIKQALPNTFPPSITHITLENFKQPIDFLPPSLTHLTLRGFNEPIQSLPPSLNLDMPSGSHAHFPSLPPSDSSHLEHFLISLCHHSHHH
jgi:hypothetical protein